MFVVKVFLASKQKGKELSREIIVMVKKDQRMRKGSVWNALVDKRNTKRLKEIIKRYGWPTLSLVGREAADGAWLLAQHADLDVRFQKKVLGLMTQAVAHGEARKKHLAYLTDRILVNISKPQLYGTQFFTDKQGILGPRPIKNPQHLAARRKAFGLEPFSLYIKRVRRVSRFFGKPKEAQRFFRKVRK